MKYLIHISIAILFTFNIIACEAEKFDNNSYQITKHQIRYKESVKDVRGVMSYKEYILILSKRNRIFVLNTETKLLKEYSSNLANFDDFITISSSILVASGDHLYYIKSMTKSNIVFEKYEYNGEKTETNDFHPKHMIDGFNITSCCLGEWGGSVYFRDSNSNTTYSTASTCLINIDTLNEEIYLFNFLGHMSGSTSVFKIGDIRSLPSIEEEEECNWYYKYFRKDYVNRDSVYSLLLGNEHKNTFIFDTIGMHILHGFATNTGIKLVHSSDSALHLLSILNEGQVEIDTELLKLKDGKRMRTNVGRNNEKITISCSERMDLQYIVNIDRVTNSIEVYSID